MDAQRTRARFGRRREDARGEARVAAMMTAHGDALRRVARRYSASADDAEDAVQRGLEIYLRRLARVDPATEVAWLKVVVKHEALAVSRARGAVLSEEDVDFDAHPADQRPPDDLLVGRERARRVGEALRGLKPDEARALLLKADGLSYAEIGDRMGWTYTKVNRCLAEGRKRFFELYAEIEAGEACERVAPALASLARGHAGAATLVELRPHLRHCGPCRATVRTMHEHGRRAALTPSAAGAP
ncbi:MAG TPA: sigma-70 family RNA polymerase sigma factor [Solirubrobacteraceae bacterium]|nr:sigma-70 family RNA polymerase sigma factor [Solirubrobacteraceae bacterium]